MEGNSKEEPGDRWVLSSLHRWNQATGRVRPSFAESDPYGPDEWAVQLHWRVVEDRAIPVGLELHSSRTGDRKGKPWPADDVPKEVTREVFKWLPVGEVVRQGREQMADFWDHLQEGSPNSEGARVARALAKAKQPGTRSDWKYRETAKAYAAAMDDPRTDRTRVALETWKRLQQHEHPELRAITYERTRKNITKARDRGYLPRGDR